MKRIVLCADGTWNEPQQKDSATGKTKPTNVLKVARAVLPSAADGAAQVVYYHEGVGTQDPWDRVTGGAFGDGMATNVRALYRFIVFNYEPGDALYLFGFSRGAFTVRTLAGFMNCVGLLQKNDEFYTPTLYDLYERSVTPGSPEWVQAFRHIRAIRPCPPMRLIAVWDTVGALGVPGVIGHYLNRGKYKYHDIGLHPFIENAYHALAIDEQRAPFAPSFWTRPPGWAGVLEQAWFPGVHSNVGGGYDPDGVANEPLHWLIEKAERLDLEFDRAFLAHYLPCFNDDLRDSMTAMYRIMGPHIREIGQHAADGEAVHQAAVDRMSLTGCKYSPANLKAYLAKGEPRVVTTTRISRGTPCPPLPPKP